MSPDCQLRKAKNPDKMKTQWWKCDGEFLNTHYTEIETTAFGCHPYGYVKKKHPVRFPAMHCHQDWKWKNWKTTGANCEPTNIQSKLLFKCQMIVVTSDLTSYVMAPGHLVSLYPFRLDRKTTKNIRLNYYPLFRKWAGALPQKDSSKRGTIPDPREQLIGAW